jgi:acyl-CoA hydrolase
MVKSKKPSASYTVMNEIVLPNDTNTLNNLRGGKILHWMDIAAAIAAQKHSNNIVVTASVDSVSFKEPIKLADVVTIEAKVSRAFNTSMEVYIKVSGENIPENIKYASNDAYYTFVALDSRMKPVKVPALEPETKDEKVKFDGALRRRQIRLIIAGKLSPDDAPELKSIFFK